MDSALVDFDFAKAGAILADMVASYLAAGAPPFNPEGADDDELEDCRSTPGAAGLHLHPPVDDGAGPLQPGEHGTAPPDDRYFCERVGGMTRGGGAPCPAVQGPSGARAAGRPRKRSASGQPAAKARRTRLAVSMTRAAILISRSRRVENSAFARSRGFGMASRTVSMSQ